jgi:putative ABC transport system permease protein
MGAFLAFKELWRSKGRYFLVSLVVALITALVLFIAGLAEGLGAGNIEYLSKLDADLLLYQEDVDVSVAASRLARSKLNDINRVPGVVEVGPISFSRLSIMLPANSPLRQRGEPTLDVSLIKVEPGQPGEPRVLEGEQLRNRRGKEAIIDSNIARRVPLSVGDEFTVKSLQGTEEEFYTLTVIGITDSQQYSIQPSIFVPFLTGEEIKPKAVVDGSANADLDSNIIAVQVDMPADPEAAAVFQETMKERLESQVSGIEAVDIKTAYENTPGYSAQQGTLNTQRYFALIIGVLVLGGFFQIQALQKVPQIGVLKAIGAPNRVIAVAQIIQTIVVTTVGVMLGAAATLGLAMGLPAGIPIVFTQESVGAAMGSLLLIGPIGGLVSVRYSLAVEPLKALGLGG